MELSCSLTRLSRETMPSVLFAQPPVVRFVPERNTCHCGAGLHVQKTRCKKVLSMIGPFIAHETVAHCSACSTTFTSDTLLRLVASRCNVAYDVLVFVGEKLFQRHRNAQEVRAELLDHNVRISISEIEYLGRKYITYLALGHKMATPRIRQAMVHAGGYVLHLDAAHEGEAPALMSGIDSLSKIVLSNVKLPSEHSDHIIPFLQKLKEDYGTPRACVHDMGTGIRKAVEEVFPDIHDFICHFHFLRDIGKDFLEPAYSELRKHLRSHATSTHLRALVRDTRQCLAEQGSKCGILANTIKGNVPAADSELMPIASVYSLALWALHGKHSGNGYGFPFDRPLLGFAQRLLELHRNLPDILNLLSIHKEDNDKQAISKMAREVLCVGNDSDLCHAVEELHWRTLIFDRLRKAMRIAPLDGGDGLNDEGSAESMSTIRQGVEKFRREIEKDSKLAKDPLAIKMARQIDKYREKLFADPIEVDSPNGPITIYPQRTNNILEQFFRGVRHGYRRKTGNNSMCRTLQAMLAETPLVRNLDNPNYMELLLNGKENLEELFAELETVRCSSDDVLQINTESILPGFRDLMKMSALPEIVIQSLSNPIRMAKSN